jgi:Short C-terminal domain
MRMGSAIELTVSSRVSVGLFSRRKKSEAEEVDVDELPEEAQEVVEKLQEMFPGASVQVSESDMSLSDALKAMHGGDLDALEGAQGGDHVSQLERLAKLHEEGALTDAEFAAEKARILGS